MGVELTYSLSFQRHLDNKFSSSKIAISSTWSKYISNPKISRENKMKIFDSASKSIMLYGAQIWGFERFNNVEKLFRFFIKKILYLPSNYPNYISHLETNYGTLFSCTVKLHPTYICRVLSLSRDRFPRILAEKIIESNLFWAKEWQNLCSIIKFSPLDNFTPLCQYWKDIVELVNLHDMMNFKSDAIRSQ